MEQVGGAGESFTDIQTYLASFNKEIQGGGAQAGQGQEYVIQQADGMNFIANADGQLTVLQAEDGTTQLVMTPQQAGTTHVKQEGAKNDLAVMNGQSQQHIEQQLMTPAPPVIDDGSDAISTMESLASGEVMVSQADASMLNFKSDGDNSGAAVQVLASMAASSIPQPDQLPAISNGPDSLTTSTTDSQAQDVVLSTGSNQYQTVTIVPSESNQGGEVSYVLIVSQPDGEQAKQESADQMDMSIYDFKEEKGRLALSTGDMTVVFEPADARDLEAALIDGSLTDIRDDADPLCKTPPASSPSAITANQSAMQITPGGDVPDDVRCDSPVMKNDISDFLKAVEGGGEMGPPVEEENEDVKKVIRVTPRKTAHGMQAQLMCNYCNYTSPKRYLLTRHMKTHSEERPHKCNICDHGFKTVASLQNHINTHTGVRPHKCKECDACFTTSGEMVRHVRYRHTFEKPHKCTECDYCSVELSKLKRHIRSHTGERPYQCPHCSYASPDTFKLKRHLRIHTGEKPYECEICHARFTQSNSLKAHIPIHTGNKPVFQCELCPTTCGRKTDLKIHVQKLHTSERPMQCRKCGKSFPDRYTYKIHLKTHDGEKCYKCELCPYAALSQRHLQSHILTHTGEKPFQCQECDQSFRQKQLLKRHMNLYHTPDYVPPPPREKVHECSECHRSFAHRGNLLRHMALHDPENPDYKNLPEATEEEEMEMEEEQIQYVQIVSEDGTEGSGPIQLQLVTEDGENTILLQMEEGQDGGSDMTPLVNALSGGSASTPISRNAGQPQHRPTQLHQQMQIQQLQPQQQQQQVTIHEVQQVQQPQQVLTQSTIVHHKQVVRPAENNEDQSPKRALRTRSAKLTNDDQKSYIVIKQEEEVGHQVDDELKDDEDDESQTIHGAVKRGIAGPDVIESPRKRRKTGEAVLPVEKRTIDGAGFHQYSVVSCDNSVHTAGDAVEGFHGNKKVAAGSDCKLSRKHETGADDRNIEVEIVHTELGFGDHTFVARLPPLKTSMATRVMDANNNQSCTTETKRMEYVEVEPKEIVLETVNTEEPTETDISGATLRQSSVEKQKFAEDNSSAVDLSVTHDSVETGCSGRLSPPPLLIRVESSPPRSALPHLTPLVPARMTTQLAQSYAGAHMRGWDTGQKRAAWLASHLAGSRDSENVEWSSTELPQSDVRSEAIRQALIQDQRDSAAVISGLSHLYMDSHLSSNVPHHPAPPPLVQQKYPPSRVDRPYHVRPIISVTHTPVTSTYRPIQPKLPAPTLMAGTVSQDFGMLSKVTNIRKVVGHHLTDLDCLMSSPVHGLPAAINADQPAASAHHTDDVAAETFENLTPMY